MEAKANSGNGRKWSLEGMTALVTGGTKGIGHAIVEELASLGATVHTCARTEADLNTCLMDWKAKGLRVSGSVCDVSSLLQREMLMKTIDSIFHGKLNIFVNNVGGPVCKHAVNYTAEDFSSVMALNFDSAFHLSQLAHPMLKASGASSIIFISSIASYLAVNFGAVYGPAKGAMNQLARNLACEWAKDNIRVNSVAPGYIKTPLSEGNFPAPCKNTRQVDKQQGTTLSPSATQLPTLINYIPPVVITDKIFHHAKPDWDSMHGGHATISFFR